MADNRFKSLDTDKLSDEQRCIAQRSLAGPRGKVSLPLKVLLRSPGAAGPFEELGVHVRFRSDIPQRLKELVIVIMARRFTALYPWSVHYPLAIEAGISASALNEISVGRRPIDLKPDEAAIYDFCVNLLDGNNISDTIFSSVVSNHGESGLIDLISLMGYYFVLNLALTVDNCPPVKNGAPLLRPLRD